MLAARAPATTTTAPTAARTAHAAIAAAATATATAAATAVAVIVLVCSVASAVPLCTGSPRTGAGAASDSALPTPATVAGRRSKPRGSHPNVPRQRRHPVGCEGTGAGGPCVVPQRGGNHANGVAAVPAGSADHGGPPPIATTTATTNAGGVPNLAPTPTLTAAGGATSPTLNGCHGPVRRSAVVPVAAAVPRRPAAAASRGGRGAAQVPQA